MVDKNQMKSSTPSVEATLRETDLGQVISRNKGPVVGGIALLVAVLVGVSLYSYRSFVKEEAMLQNVFQAEQEVFSPYFLETVEHEAVVANIKSIDPSLIGNPNLTTSVFEVAGLLVEAQREDLALEVLELWQSGIDKRSHLALYSGLRLAVLYENQSRPDDAVNLYEELLKRNFDLLEDKIYYELGRLYFQRGESEKSKSFFDHILTHYSESEYAKRVQARLDEVSE